MPRYRARGVGVCVLSGLLICASLMAALPLTPIRAEAAPASQLSLPWTVGTTAELLNGPHTNNKDACNYPTSDPCNALDLVPQDSHVRAARSGVAHLPCGNLVTVDHGDGWITGYYHLQNIVVSEGQPVSTGQILGDIGTGHGCGGLAVGAHTHFFVKYAPGNPQAATSGVWNATWDVDLQNFVTGGELITKCPGCSSGWPGLGGCMQRESMGQQVCSTSSVMNYNEGVLPPPPVGSLQITTALRPAALGALTDVFTRGTNGHAWHAVTQLNGTTSAWEDLQGNLAGEPAAMWNSAGTELDVYAIAVDNHVWHDQYFTSSGTWTGWGSSPWPGGATAGSSTTENITVTTRGPGAGMDLLMRGTDGGGWLAVAHADGSYWAGWYSFQGHLLGAPSGSFSTDGSEFDAFAIGTDNQVYVDRYDAACGNWFCGWQPMGGSSEVGENEMVASVRESNNSVDLEVMGTNNAAWLFNTSAPFNPGTWSSLYGNIVGTPNMDWIDSTHLTSYAVAPDDTLWWTIWSGGPSAWQALPVVSLLGGKAG